MKEVDDVNARVAIMTRKLEALKSKKVLAVEDVVRKGTCCLVYETTEHDTSSCPIIPSVNETLHGQVNAIDQFQWGRGNPYSNTYNPRWRNHPNFG